MMKRLGIVLIGLSALVAAFAPVKGLRGQVGGRAPAGAAVQAEMFADTTAVTPGKAFTLAITLTTNPGWHIYWQNPGESGLPTTFQFTVPVQGKAALLTMPLPHTFVQPGGITGYGYTGKAVFLAQVTLPATYKPIEGVPLKFGVDVSWLCCDKDQCVPGGEKLSVELPVGGEGKEANGALFTAARGSLPSPEPPAGLASLSALTAGLANQYTMEIAWAKPVTGVEVFPEAVDGLVFDVKGTNTAAATSVVSINAHVMAGQHLKTEKLPLWVAYTGQDGVRKGFITHVDLHAFGARAAK